jgi:hypothetical protein
VRSHPARVLVGSGLPRTHNRAMPANKRAVYLNEDLHKGLRARAAAMDLTVAELVSKATRTFLSDAADEATFGQQEPNVSFRGARSKTKGKKVGTKAARKVGEKVGKKGAKKVARQSSKKRRP